MRTSASNSELARAEELAWRLLFGAIASCIVVTVLMIALHTDLLWLLKAVGTIGGLATGVAYVRTWRIANDAKRSLGNESDNDPSVHRAE